jgi:hypothetical protein
MPGVLAILDRYRAHPVDDAMAEAMGKSATKEHQLLAMMAGRSSAHDAAAARVGAQIESQARALRPARPLTTEDANNGLLERIKAVLAA